MNKVKLRTMAAQIWAIFFSQKNVIIWEIFSFHFHYTVLTQIFFWLLISFFSKVGWFGCCSNKIWRKSCRGFFRARGKMKVELISWTFLALAGFERQTISPKEVTVKLRLGTQSQILSLNVKIISINLNILINKSKYFG